MEYIEEKISEEKSEFKKFYKNVKKTWDWIWNSNSILSWIIALAIIYIFVKFLFFPGLSLMFGTSLPLAGVESSSMDHQIVPSDYGTLNLCGNTFTKEEKEYINFEKYWENCGNWYENNGITKEEFSNFPLKNGFRKGDIVIVWGRFTPKIGDIIIFKPNKESTAPRPIVHRIVEIKENKNLVIETKGDHNKEQLKQNNNIYKTDETEITQEQIIGKVIFKIPLLGWFKIIVVEILKGFFQLFG